MKIEIIIKEGGPLEASMTIGTMILEKPQTELELDHFNALHHFLTEEFDDEYIEKYKDYEL